MKKKFLLGTIATLALFTTIASASTGQFSYVHISANSTGEDGPTISMSGAVELSGENSSTSTNSLWLEVYEDQWGPDRQEVSTPVPVGCHFWPRNFNISSSGNYYVHLDPAGTLYTGCVGWGNALD